MTTHRRYYFVHEGPWPGDYEKTREELGRQCARNWWYNNAEILGEALGLFELRVTVSGEDQWRVHKRAMALVVTVYAINQLEYRAVPVPYWEPLEPHTNRGYSRFL